MAHPPAHDDRSADRELADGSSDRLVREEPLVIRLGDQQVLTMRTPGDDVNLATGFLLSEGVLASASDIRGCETIAGDPEALQADTIVVDATAATPGGSGRLTRTHEIRSSCGICGLVDADALLDDTLPLLPGVPTWTRAEIATLGSRFEESQHLFAATGASHGAELFGPDGTSWGRGEDVGRHNALDKAIGAAARGGHDLAHATAFLSGRAGYDLVFKCLRLRIPVILSVSAASALSFDLCRSAGATLIGFVRGDRLKVYVDAGRLT